VLQEVLELRHELTAARPVFAASKPFRPVNAPPQCRKLAGIRRRIEHAQHYVGRGKPQWAGRASSIAEANCTADPDERHCGPRSACIVEQPDHGEEDIDTSDWTPTMRPSPGMSPLTD
jgi:hypothetical protein